MKVIKNLDNTDHTWAGTLIPANSSYVVQNHEDAHSFVNDDSFVASLSSQIATVNNGISDISGLSNQLNHLNDVEQSVKDIDGRALMRPVAAKSGWTYFMCPIEFATSDMDSLYTKKFDGNDRAIATYKIYDSNGAEITDSQYEANAVKTVVDIEPAYDYEIIGGQLQQHTKPTTNIRLWVVGVPDVAEQYGGSKEMVGGVNLKYIDPTDKVHADGRVSKYMTYNATYHTNKLRLIFTHNAGLQHEVMMILEMFKA